jgi:nucleotide-binding universal stress UspA family protein
VIAITAPWASKRVRWNWIHISGDLRRPEEVPMPTLQASLRLTFSNILFPTDFSDASTAALPYAQAFAKTYGARILVTHAVMPRPPIFLPMELVPLEMDGEWYDARDRLSHFLDNDALKGTLHEGITGRGELWNVLDEVIQRHDIDLIIVGSHGKHGLKKLVLGSDAEQIFRKSRRPVLTIGPKVVPQEENAAFRTIVFATDFSAGSLQALPYARSLAEENQAKLILLHVIPLVSLQHQEPVSENAYQRLRELIPSEAADWCCPECIVRLEFPAEGILNLAREEHADLIVMGVHKGTPFASTHLPWAIAYEVVCDAPCPVLTVRD